MSTLKRREIREHLLKMLYLRDYHDLEDLPEENVMYFDQFTELDEAGRKIVDDRYEAILAKLGEVDHIIAGAMSGWSMSRVSRVELNILRIAVFEILFDDDIPDKVAINEAVEITKFYGSEDTSYGFVNGILAKIVKNENLFRN